MPEPWETIALIVAKTYSHSAKTGLGATRTMQPRSLKAEEFLDQEFLVLRAKILEIAAALDRLDRGDGDVGGDPRVEKLRRSLAELSSGERDRAERIQMIFSLPYDEDWRRRMD